MPACGAREMGAATSTAPAIFWIGR